MIVKLSERIFLCSMAGGDCETFVEEQNDVFRTLTIDIVDDVLYWVLHYANKIESSLIDQKERRTVYQVWPGKTVTGLSVFEHRMSWIETDASTSEVDAMGFVTITSSQTEESRFSTVYSMDKKSYRLSTKVVIRDELPISHSLGMLQEQSQPLIDLNVCTILPCTYFCWTNSAISCKCPTTRLHSTTAYPLPINKYCGEISICPSPISNDGHILEVKKIDDGVNGIAEVSCRGESRILYLKCQADGTWMGLPNCEFTQSDVTTVPNTVRRITSNRNFVSTTKAVVSVAESTIPDSNFASTTKADVNGEESTVTSMKHGGNGAYSTHARNIALALIVVIMVVIIVGLLVWWKRKKGFSLFKRGGFSPQKLTSPRTSVSEVAGYYNSGYIVSYRPTEENSDAAIAVETGNSNHNNNEQTGEKVQNLLSTS